MRSYSSGDSLNRRRPRTPLRNYRSDPVEQPLLNERTSATPKEDTEWKFMLALAGIALFYMVGYFVIQGSTGHLDKLLTSLNENPMDTSQRIVYEELHNKRAKDFKRRSGMNAKKVDIDISNKEDEKKLLDHERIPNKIPRHPDDIWNDWWKPQDNYGYGNKKKKSNGYDDWFGDDYFKHDDKKNDRMRDLFPHLYDEKPKEKKATDSTAESAKDSGKKESATLDAKQPEATLNQGAGSVPSQGTGNANQNQNAYANQWGNLPNYQQNQGYANNPYNNYRNQPAYNQQQPIYNNPYGYQNAQQPPVGNFQPGMNTGQNAQQPVGQNAPAGQTPT